MTVSTDKLIVDVSNGVGRLVLNQPEKHNAISAQMWQGIADAMRAFAADGALRVAVLSGAGEKAFSAGADISEFEAMRASSEAVESYDRMAHEAVESIVHLDKPTIAMIQGYCIGGGTELALSCDLRIASQDARFGIPAARLGLAYRWQEVHPLVQLVGPSAAKEILFTGRQFSAEEALRMGLINQVVPRSALASKVEEYAERIAANAPLTIRAAKRTVAEAMKDPGARDLDTVREMVDACFASDDYAEGRKAFMEKRPPEFKGR
ncbi:MAG: enoyl-CoA hydratase [Gammaproteobacteria bacterium]|nr:enoyl-CoA hydratase [Gammaproteobacteria bacterium]NIM71658.1 enoyl-CoA hydratase [Gammaproteobacteria bacterium]NIO23402.1 enoyl-CoA hydratase [Gammaproteobacteria bacterium]NIO64023.1 enoyl-CoA hydratase [Gammaproteobacteria bacterium]NIP46132.1 enoyl-CoA hydratase [Gammaproteobacteria bacterium]